DRRVVSGPLPHRRGAHDLRVRDHLLVLQLARVDADRAEPELAAPLLELLEQPLERRAAVASLAHSRAGEPEAHRLLRRPEHDLVTLLERRTRDQKRERHLLRIFHPGREVDEHLAGHTYLPCRGRASWAEP